MPELPRWQNVESSVSGSASNDAEPRSDHWYQEYAAYHYQDFMVELDRIAVDEKQIQLKTEEKACLYAAIDVDTKVVLHVQISLHRGRDPAEQLLSELKEKHRISDAELLVDGMGYLTALA